MLPNHSAESKPNRGAVPTALYGRYLRKSPRHTCTAVTPRLVGPGFSLGIFQPQHNWHSGIRPKAGSRRNSTHGSSQNILPFPRWLPKQLQVPACSWHLRVFSRSKYMESKASPYEKLFKELEQVLNNSVCFFVLRKILPHILYHDPCNPFPRGKKFPIHLVTSEAFAIFISPFY